ncbi:hypothetical protein [Lacipirellula limnantheis]|uniref:hypothetical protein n=1 Tax=Lacipirellula limnantheis TaxID=2528024 RepID=UPI003703C733
MRKCETLVRGQFTPVPEPTSARLGVLGLAFLSSETARRWLTVLCEASTESSTEGASATYLTRRGSKFGVVS